MSGIVTAPINKAALSRAGINYPGHTEILADFGGAPRVAMMLANDDIRTVLVTIHISLRISIEQADFPAQMSAIRLAHAGCRAARTAALIRSWCKGALGLGRSRAGRHDAA